MSEINVDGKERIVYIRDWHRTPMGVVVYKLDGGTALAAVASQNPMDSWDRQRGLSIARGRLNSGKSDRNICVDLGEEKNSFECMLLVLLAVANPENERMCGLSRVTQLLLLDQIDTLREAREMR